MLQLALIADRWSHPATWPATKIVIRADSGFCRGDSDIVRTIGWTMWWVWHAMKAIDYSRPNVLVTKAARRRAYSRILPIVKKRSRERRVVGKAEYCRVAIPALWSSLSCVLPHNRSMRSCIVRHGRIKEQQLGLFADRTSCSVFRANELRLKFSSRCVDACVVLV